MGTQTSYSASNFSAALNTPELQKSQIDPLKAGLKTGAKALSATSSLATTVPWGTIASGAISIGAGLWSGLSASNKKKKQQKKFREKFTVDQALHNEGQDNLGRARDATNNAGYFSNVYAQEGTKLAKPIFKTDSTLQANEDVPFVKRMVKEKIKGLPDGEKTMTHKLGYVENNGKYDVYPHVQDIDGILKHFPKKDWKEAYESARTNNNTISFEKEEDAKRFSNDDWKKWHTEKYGTQFKNGGTLSESSQLPVGVDLMKRFIDEFEFSKQEPTKHRQGGKLHVIPDGALHSRKNKHGDKGVPVVVENGEDYDKTAEIEREELILSKKISEYLEAVVKQYQENPDDKALLLEIGTLLKDELLNNTDDKTNKFL